MTGKYDRNVEEMERARLEEGRIWSQRNPESGIGSYGPGAVVGLGEPFWWAQNRASIPSYIHPMYGPQVPIAYSPAQLPPHVMQGTFAGQQPGFLHGMQAPFQSTQSQQLLPSAFSQFPQQQIHPSLLHQNPLLYSNPFLFASPTQTFPYLMNPYPVLNPFQTLGFEPQWGGQPSIYKQPSRAFFRPPRGYKRSDELIRDEICKRLALTPEIDATDVEVIVKDGEVSLKGIVDDRFAKRIVEDIAETTFGVRDVLNDIRLASRFEQELYGTTKGKEK